MNDEGEDKKPGGNSLVDAILGQLDKKFDAVIGSIRAIRNSIVFSQEDISEIKDGNHALRNRITQLEFEEKCNKHKLKSL